MAVRRSRLSYANQVVKFLASVTLVRLPLASYSWRTTLPVCQGCQAERYVCITL